VKKKILLYIRGIGLYLLRKVLVFDLGLVVLVGLSFLVWKGFSAAAYSERMVWTGIGFFLVSGILVMAQTSGGRNFGVSGQFTSTAHAESMMEWNREIRRDIEDRFDFRFQIFLIGAFALLIGIFIQVAFD
jgi:hypothetical protein